MKIIVIGAGGMVGAPIAAELTRRGEDVVGVSRSTGVDVTDPAAVAAAAAGADAVVSATSARGVDYSLADVARSLADGLRLAGVPRVVVIGGAGSLEVAPGVRLLDTPDFPEAYRSEAEDAAEALLVFRSITDLDWTYVSPAAFIHPGERTGRYRLGGDELLVDESGKSEISAEDFAIAVADLLMADSDAHVRERVTAAW